MEFEMLKGKFDPKEARMLNPLVLAFAGDAVYEVFVRTFLIEKNREMLVHKLHTEAVCFVKAHAQCQLMKQLEGELNEEETVIYKRGRNAKSSTVPKNADVQEYRIATGFETVIGFLYLSEQNERLNYLLKRAAEIVEGDF